MIEGDFNNLGSWVTRAIVDPEDKAPGYYDGPIFFAGDHCSHIIGWQEDAALSAHRALKLICEKVDAARKHDPGLSILQAIAAIGYGGPSW